MIERIRFYGGKYFFLFVKRIVEGKHFSFNQEKAVLKSRIVKNCFIGYKDNHFKFNFPITKVYFSFCERGC